MKSGTTITAICEHIESPSRVDISHLADKRLYQSYSIDYIVRGSEDTYKLYTRMNEMSDVIRYPS